MKYFVYAL